MRRTAAAASRIASSLALLAVVAMTAEAQFPKTVMTISGFVTFPAPTANDYAAGFINSTSGLTFTLDATQGNQDHTTIVLIRSLSATLGGAKPLGDLQWRRSDLATWTSISVTNVEIERRPQVRNGVNDPWSNTIFFRMLLNWATDPPATYSANYQLTLSQTVP